MLDFANGLKAAFLVLASEPRLVAILIGLLICIAGTQFLKFRIPWPEALAHRYRWAVRAVSLPLGAIPTYHLWPAPRWPVALYVALTVGLVAPWLYKLATGLLYLKWPGLELKLSADPFSDKDQP